MTESVDNASLDQRRGAEPLLRPSGRLRALLFVAVNLVGFGVVNAFWQYLRTGRWLDLSVDAYQTGLAETLSDMFIEPLSIFTHPWMILVTSLLLALIFLVPIIVAVLYGEVLAILFVFLVAGVGHATALGLFLAAGCVLAARTRLSREAPFLAFLLGMVPVVIYLIMASVEVPCALPLQRWVLRATMVIAVVLAAVSASVVLGLARLTRFRPAMAWPMLVVLLLAPISVFHYKVGSDELSYALLARSLAGPDALFEPTQVETWRRSHNATGLQFTTLKNRISENMVTRKRVLTTGCQRFVERFGQSERAPAAMWIQAQARSLMLDESAYKGHFIAYSADFPVEASRKLWQELLARYPASEQAGLASWRLGELALRRGDMAEGDDLLHSAVGRIERTLAGASARRGRREAGAIFQPARSMPARRGYEYYEGALLSAKRLLWLMQENDVLADKQSAEALAEYLSVNPRSAAVFDELSILAGRYEGTKMADNLKLAVAKVTPDHIQRAEMLIKLAGRRATDAAIEANFVLGTLSMKPQMAAVRLVEGLKEPEDYFKAVIAARDNPWQRRATTHLAWLTAQPD